MLNDDFKSKQDLCSNEDLSQSPATKTNIGNKLMILKNYSHTYYFQA